MKNTNICPKCQSTDVIKLKTFKSTSSSNTVQLTKWGTQSAFFDRYLCLSCGFIEQYADLEDANWQKWIERQKEENALDSDFV